MGVVAEWAESCLALKESRRPLVGFTIIIEPLTTGPRPLPTPSCTSGEIPPPGGSASGPQGPGPHPPWSAPYSCTGRSLAIKPVSERLPVPVIITSGGKDPAFWPPSPRGSWLLPSPAEIPLLSPL